MAGKAGPYLSAGLIATAAVVVLGLYTGDQWLDPSTPLLIGAIAAFPLGLIGALLLHPEARSAPSRFLKVGSLVAISAAIGVGVPALWSLSQVRTAVIDQGGDYVNVRAAIDDADPGVQDAACHHLLDGEASVIDTSDMLADRPALAVRCLPASDTTKADIVAENLAVAWHRKTVSEEPLPPSNQCLHAEALGALSVEAGSKKARLLDCALRAPSNGKRMCCVDTLLQLGASCEQLAEEVDARVLVEAGSAGTLLALSKGEETLSRELKGVARRLNLTCEAMQLVGLQLACASLGREGENSTAVLDWVLEENKGCMSAEDREDDAAIPEVCEALTDNLRRGGDADDAAICQAQRKVVAEQQARLAQLRGPSAEESARLAGQISRGRAQADGRNNTLEQFVASLQGQAGAPDLESYTEADKQRIMERMQKNAMTPEEAMAIPTEALSNVQEKYEAIKGKDKLQAALENAGEPAPGEAFDEKVGEAQDKFDQVSERVAGEKSKAESQQGPSSPKRP